MLVAIIVEQHYIVVTVLILFSQDQTYRKILKISDTRKFAVITLKVEQDGFSLE